MYQFSESCATPPASAWTCASAYIVAVCSAAWWAWISGNSMYGLMMSRLLIIVRRMVWRGSFGIMNWIDWQWCILVDVCISLSVEDKFYSILVSWICGRRARRIYLVRYFGLLLCVVWEWCFNKTLCLSQFWESSATLSFCSLHKMAIYLVWADPNVIKNCVQTNFNQTPNFESSEMLNPENTLFIISTLFSSSFRSDVSTKLYVWWHFEGLVRNWCSFLL